MGRKVALAATGRRGVSAALQIGAVLTIDPDFDVYRDRTGKPLANLMRGGGRKRR